MIFIDRFSVGLDELPIKLQSDRLTVLRIIAKKKRFSTFEVTPTLGKTLDEMKGVLFYYDGGEYPWHEVKITKKGRALLKEQKK